MPRRKKTDNGIGHNDPPQEGEPPPGVSAQVLAECYAAYAVLVEERTRLNWDIAALFDQFEARGVKAKEKKAIKAAYSTAHNKDQTAARDQHHINVAVMLAVGVLTTADTEWTQKAKQAELFPDATTQGEIAYRRGFSAGRGDAAVHCLVKSLNPHTPGTRAHEGYNDGWDVGASDRERAGLPAPDRTERKKPGRQKSASASPEPPESEGLTPNGPTEADVAEQTAEAKAGWSASDFTGPAEIIH